MPSRETVLAYLARMRPGDVETHNTMPDDQLRKLATDVKAMADLIRKVQAARQGKRYMMIGSFHATGA